MKQILERCKECIEIITLRKKEILDILTSIETLSMAEDEVERCLDLLEHINIQKGYMSRVYNKSMSSFLPLNQPIYSYFLQVFLPSLILNHVYFRPPVNQTYVFEEIYRIFERPSYNIDICSISRRKFIRNYASKCDIVNFTGKYESVIELMKELPKEIALVYNGSAVNPIVIGSDANVDSAVVDSIAARLYNSGQDCMAPACIFVDRAISISFVDLLTKKLESLVVGDNKNPVATIGPMLESESIVMFKNFKNEYASNVVFGGGFDEKEKLIAPTVFLFDGINTNVQNIYYAPYFVIMVYDSVSDIHTYLNSSFCELYAGYISLYGASLYEYEWKSGDNILIPLRACTLYSEEDGNSPFGGYGKGCSFIYYNNACKSGPVLLLREMNKIWGENGCI